MATNVEYVLSLRDQMSGSVDSANTHVNKLESSLKSAGSMLATLGVGFAVFKGAEFIHEGVEAFHALEQSMAKVEANLKSTGEAAGLGMKDITDMAKSLSSQVQFSRSEVMDMQSQLLTFPSITKEVFERSMGMVTDIAKQTNHGLSETAIMFGKAFNDPAKGLQKLMRYGVMFTDQQKDMIKQLQESGHLIQAQQAMLDAIATSGYEGVAKAMAQADPLFQYNKIMGGIKITVGEAATSLLTELTPALESFANTLKQSILFLKEHWDLIKKLTISLGAAFLAMKAFTIVPPLFLAISDAIRVAAASGTIFTAVMDSALGPVGLLVLAIGGLVYAYQSVGEAKALSEKEKATDKEKAINDITKKNDENVAFYEKTMDHKDAMIAAKNFQVKDLNDKISSGWDKLTSDKYKGQDASSNQSDEYKQLVKEQNILAFKLDATKEYTGPSSQIKGAKPKTMASVEPADKTKADTKSKATGSKSVTINVSIKDLIGVQNINTTNLKEGAGKIKDLVVSVLTGAVNDFQVVASQ